MTLPRLTQPLTALSLCVLIGWGAAAPARAQDNGVSDRPDPAIIATEEGAAEIGEAAGMPPTMPPMAPVNETPAPAPEAVLPKTMQQLRTLDMNRYGPRDAYLDPGSSPAVARTQGEPYVDPAGDTHPALKLTPDKSSLIRLPRPAASVIVGNEAHVNILIDSPVTLVAVPRQPGASYFTVLDNEGRVIMQRHVIVAAPADNYVRIRRSCTGTAQCEETSVYYCPNGMCHQVTTRQTPGAAPAQGPIGRGPTINMGRAGGLGNAETGGYEDYNTPPPDFSGGIPFPFFIPFNFGGNGGE